MIFYDGNSKKPLREEAPGHSFLNLQKFDVYQSELWPDWIIWYALTYRPDTMKKKKKKKK